MGRVSSELPYDVAGLWALELVSGDDLPESGSRLSRTIRGSMSHWLEAEVHPYVCAAQCRSHSISEPQRSHS